MAEETKPVRLSKAAKEVNVSVGTIVEFLGKKGHEVEAGPNTKLSGEQYLLVLKEFQSDKLISEKAQGVQLEAIPKKVTVEAKESPKETVEEAADSVEGDLIIKTSEISAAPVKKTSKKAKETKETEAEPEVSVSEPAEEVPVVEEKKAKPAASKKKKAEEAPEQVAEKVQEEQSEPEKAPQVETISEPVAEAEPEPQPAPEPAPEPEVKPEPEPAPKREEVAAAEEKKPESPKEKLEKLFEPSRVAGPKILSVMDAKELDLARKGKAVKPDKIERPQIVEPEPVPEPKPEAVQPKEDNFIKTEYVKIDGPKITGQKVDLSQFERKPKPVASSKENPGALEKRRKRIKKDAPNAGGTPQQGGSGGLEGLNRRFSNAPQPGGNRPPKGPRGNNGKRNAPPAPSVMDEQEIEKQMKETLARLSPMGKSKTSKHNREKRQMVRQHMEAEMAQEMQERKVLKVTEFVTVNELSSMMNVPVTQIIGTCMSLGLFVSINQRLSAEPISLLAEEYGFKVEFVDAEVIHELENKEVEEDAGEEVGRTPIVTVMGHVDHGKTSLLDYIRKTNVIAGEAGGITQHIGAYEVELEDGRKITFLDTPGHEAFTAMRARGAKMTDIAIIVVAADDRVMPQTVEAINHAQAAGVPIIFAINKVDKPAADPERIKSELAEMNLLVEDWGGKYQSQDISAKSGLGVESLLEKVLLEAEMLDLKAHPERRGKGTVIESSLDKGRGYVAKILVQDGTVRVGDFILAGPTFGRVKAMYNERNQPMKEAGPSQPLLLLGLNGAPQPGDVFNVMTDEKEAKEIAGKRLQLQREQGMRAQKHITLDDIGRRIAIGNFKELNIIVKADVDGSVEALSDSLLKLSTPEVQVNVIHKSVGQITESDIMLAAASEAIIVGFQVRPSVAARKLAENEKIDIRLYSIIYDAINELKDAIEGMLSPVIQERIVANLEIREVFKISKVGSIAGCIVLDGRLGRNTKIRIIRDGIVVYTGELGSLRRFKDDVKEVLVGQDCGLNIKNFNDIKVGDIIEGYEQVEIKRTL
ncbi:MAG: translation initiation factor IF-2 [Bacteroides sp.]|nr:translation initiation factor IF-2 [Ruminococcus flavefaciens]MCM1554010.1 translation initiation factor IF-2 [Bacteroides sp.]